MANCLAKEIGTRIANWRTGWRMLLTAGAAALLCVSAWAQAEARQATTAEQTELEAAMAGEPAARAEALRQFLKAHPEAGNADAAREELVRALAVLGEARLVERDIDGAVTFFRQAIAVLPKRLEDKFFEETAARIPLAVSVRGYRSEAIMLALAMEAHFAGDTKRLAAMGEFYLSIEAPSDALRALSAAVAVSPNDARLRRMRGTAYRMSLLLDAAAGEFKQAIKLDPAESRAYFELANLERARGNNNEAARLYQKQLEVEPQHAASLKGLALAHLSQNDEARAKEALGQAEKVGGSPNAQDLFLQTQLAFVYLKLGKLAPARQAADAAIAVEPRYSWARIAAAELDLNEGNFFNAERNLLAALKFSNFPTLYFTLGQVYLYVEDFDGALEAFDKAYSYKAGKFQTRLGGVLDLKAATLSELLARERQASLFIAEPSTSEIEFKLAEALTKFDTSLRSSKGQSSGLVSSLAVSQASAKGQQAEVEKAVKEFVEAEGSRQYFRALYVAQRLVKSGQLLELAVKIAEQVNEKAEAATAAEGSLRDYPNYDREGRTRVLRGRALDVRGTALLKLGRKAEAAEALKEAVLAYGSLPERRRAQWHLASAKEAVGDEQAALDLYLAAYEPPEKSATDLNRAVIESLYRKINGSLDGMEERLGKETTLTAGAKTTLAAGSEPAQALPIPAKEPVAAATPALATNDNPAGNESPVKPEGKPDGNGEATEPGLAAKPEARMEMAATEPRPAKLASEVIELPTSPNSLSGVMLLAFDVTPLFAISPELTTELETGEAAPDPTTITMASAERPVEKTREAATESGAPAITADPKPAGEPSLPSEIEARATALGLSSGNLGRGLAAGVKRSADPEDAPSTDSPTVHSRPRRITPLPASDETAPATRKRRATRSK